MPDSRRRSQRASVEKKTPSRKRPSTISKEKDPFEDDSMPQVVPKKVLIQSIVATPKRRPSTVVAMVSTPSTSSGDKPSPIKTRMLHKAQATGPKCTLCCKTKGDLFNCFKCGLQYHLQKCLLYSEETAKIATNLKQWLCPKCIRCAKCTELIDDPTNKECCQCLKVWHGKCLKTGYTGPDWTCSKCSGKTSTPKTNKSPISRVNTPKLSPKEEVPNSGVRRRGRPRKESFLSTNDPLRQEDETTENILTARGEIWNQLVDHQEKHKIMVRRSSKSPVKERTRSPEKKVFVAPKKIAIQEDYDIFQSALSEYLQEKQASDMHEVVPETTTGKYVYVGSDEKMKALYDSPYTEDVRKATSIYICQFCLYPTGDPDIYRIHQENCQFTHPPGNEIYRNDEISFFEVDGAVQKNYCRNLCLLSKMFISSKTLHHEVDTFLFYILTEITSIGCRLVGYFSKEKNPSKNNNLSCLLTLPSESRRGYGRLLIDMSYKLSALELKVGSPEHPLSDLGLVAYRGYWRSSIVCYLRSISTVPQTSIKAISLATRIHPTDIVNQMLRDKLLVYKDGNYFVKTGRRAYKFPLSVCRRRAIEADKVIWKPEWDTTQLDPTKINYYV